MDIALRRLAIVASLLTSAVCSGSNTSPTPPPLTGSVTDLTGDTVPGPSGRCPDDAGSADPARSRRRHDRCDRRKPDRNNRVRRERSRTPTPLRA
jgi:hypothetical protein